MVLTAATILFILFWIHQYFQLGVPDDALFFLRRKLSSWVHALNPSSVQLILGLLYLPIIGSFFMRTCCDDGMSNKPSTDEILAEYGRVGGRKHSMNSFNSQTRLGRSSSSWEFSTIWCNHRNLLDKYEPKWNESVLRTLLVEKTARFFQKVWTNWTLISADSQILRRPQLLLEKENSLIPLSRALNISNFTFICLK